MCKLGSFSLQLELFIRYDTIQEFNVDSKAEYSALSSTRSQKKKLKQTTQVPLLQYSLHSYITTALYIA